MSDPHSQGDGRAAQANGRSANRAIGSEGLLAKPMAQASNSPGEQAPSPSEGPFAAIDPGRSKCGLVISDNQASVIKRADGAMYQAKQTGKNRVISAP